MDGGQNRLMARVYGDGNEWEGMLQCESGKLWQTQGKLTTTIGMRIGVETVAVATEIMKMVMAYDTGNQLGRVGHHRAHGN